MRMRTGAKNVRARPFSHTKTDFGDWSWKEKILINHISNNNKKFQQHWSVHMRTGAKKRTCADVFSRARLFSHSNMHCRDYAWKDKILNDHLSNNNKKIQPHRGVHVRTRAENIHVPLFSLSHGRFLIVKCILETCHKQKKYSLTIYLIVGCVLSKLSQGFYVFILCKLSLNIQMY